MAPRDCWVLQGFKHEQAPDSESHTGVTAIKLGLFGPLGIVKHVGSIFGGLIPFMLRVEIGSRSSFRFHRLSQELVGYRRHKSDMTPHRVLGAACSTTL